jgi:hypothetical protein
MEEKIVTKEEVWAGFDRLEKMLAENAEIVRKGHEEELKLHEEERKMHEKECKFYEKERKLYEKERKLREAESKRRDEESKKRDAEGRKLDKRIKAVTEQMGGMCNSEGASEEELFATSLAKKMTFAGQRYDAIEYNLKKKAAGLEDEFDVVLSNGSSVAVIEVKYKACQADVVQLTTKKVANFRTLYPLYKDYKVYLGIGSMSFDDRVIEKAKELGVGLLRQQGNSIETESAYVRAY